MWQLNATGSLIATAIENAFDKIALVRVEAIDSSVATFWRAFFFCLGTMFLGLFSGFQFFFHWSILCFALLSVLSSFCYTTLLRKVEITSIGVVAYAAPLIFLVVDATLVGMSFSLLQILGVVLLVAGGVAFSLDGKTRRLKKQLTLKVLCVFCFNTAYMGGEAYLFKFINSHYGVNGPSFFGNLWMISSLVLLMIVIIRGKTRCLVDTHAMKYVPYVMVSKGCDCVSAVMWAGALSIASVSQVSAFEALFPLILLTITFIGQRLGRLSLGEQLDSKRLFWKGGAVGALVIGGLLIS